MRTGTHYFPRVNGVAAVERNCQKFGLNKIEETANENATTPSSSQPPLSELLMSSMTTTVSASMSSSTSTTASMASSTANCHRRAESFDFSRNCSSPFAMSVNASKDASESIVMRTMSPDIQRRLAYQNFRGFECKQQKYIPQATQITNYANCCFHSLTKRVILFICSSSFVLA